MKSIVINKDKNIFLFNQAEYNLNAGNITLLIHRIISNEEDKGLSADAVVDANNIRLDFYTSLKKSIRVVKENPDAAVDTFEEILSNYFNRIIQICNNMEPTFEIALLLGCNWLVITRYLSNILSLDGQNRPLGKVEGDIYKSMQRTIDRL